MGAGAMWDGVNIAMTDTRSVINPRYIRLMYVITSLAAVWDVNIFDYKNK